MAAMFAAAAGTCPIFEQMAVTTKAATNEAFMRWLGTNGFMNAIDFAIMCDSEKACESQLIAPAEADGVKFVPLVQKTFVKKLWAAADAHRAAEAQAKARAVGAAGTVEAEISPETVADLSAAWFKKHAIVIPDAWLLTPLLQGKLWRSIQLDPVVMDVLLVETLRPMSCSDKSAGAHMQLVPGKAPVVVQTLPSDSVNRPFEFYARIRAWFVTMADVATRHPDFMDLQTAIHASDTIFGFLSQTFSGQPAPLAFYIYGRIKSALPNAR